MPATEITSLESTLPATSAQKRRWIEGGLIAIFWFAMAMLLIGQRSLNEFGPFDDGLATEEILQAFALYLFWALITPLIFWLSKRFGLDRKDWYRWIAIHVVVGVVIAMGAELYGWYTQEVFGFNRGRRFKFDPVRAIFDLWWINELFLYMAVLAAGFARGYFRKYQARRKEAALLQTQATKLQAQLAESRLMSLRMQLNPHFLFNTLNAISSLVDRDPSGVRRIIARLSELLRHTLDGDAGQEVTLEEELHFLNRYLEIEQLRFQSELEVYQDISPDVLHGLVPNLILQPLVENAVKHGATRIKGVGRIDISAWKEGPYLFLSVQDNGPGFSKSEDEPEGVGLNNTRARLEALYGREASLEIVTAANAGVAVTVKLPFRTKADIDDQQKPAKPNL